MGGADGMSTKFMKSAFVGWTFTAGLYYPPDFDQSKLMPVKHLRPKGQKVPLMNIRMMFPFTMICDACSEYNYTGTKFTAKVEKIANESYLSLSVYRFYGRCKHCWAEFTFKTDPKNSDYTMESGGKRTYEAWKDADMAEAEIKQNAAQEAARDQMKALEQKSIDVQAEMQRIEDLDAIRTMNKRGGARDQTIEDALEFLFKKQQSEAAESAKAEEELDDGEIKQLKSFQDERESMRIKRLDDEVESVNEVGAGSSKRPPGPADVLRAAAEKRAAAGSTAACRVGAVFAKKRRTEEPNASPQAEAASSAAASSAAASTAASPAASPVPESEVGEAVETSVGSGCGALGLGGYDTSDSS